MTERRPLNPWMVVAFWVAVALGLIVVFNIWPAAAAWSWGKPAMFGFGIALGAVMLWLQRKRSKA